MGKTLSIFVMELIEASSTENAHNLKWVKWIRLILMRGRERSRSFAYSNSALCGPVCGFGSRVGKRHQQPSKQDSLEPRGPVVNE